MLEILSWFQFNLKLIPLRVGSKFLLTSNSSAIYSTNSWLKNVINSNKFEQGKL